MSDINIMILIFIGLFLFVLIIFNTENKDTKSDGSKDKDESAHEISTIATKTDTESTSFESITSKKNIDDNTLPFDRHSKNSDNYEFIGIDIKIHEKNLLFVDNDSNYYKIPINISLGGNSVRVLDSNEFNSLNIEIGYFGDINGGEWNIQFLPSHDQVYIVGYLSQSTLSRYLDEFGEEVADIKHKTYIIENVSSKLSKIELTNINGFVKSNINTTTSICDNSTDKHLDIISTIDFENGYNQVLFFRDWALGIDEIQKEPYKVFQINKLCSSLAKKIKMKDIYSIDIIELEFYLCNIEYLMKTAEMKFGYYYRISKAHASFFYPLLKLRLDDLIHENDKFNNSIIESNDFHEEDKIKISNCVFNASTSPNYYDSFGK